MKNKRVVAIALNALIFIFEVIALIMCFADGTIIEDLKYYTIISNILMMVVSALYVLFAIIRNHDVPYFVVLLKYISTCCLALTFATVVFVLIPLTFGFSTYIEGAKQLLLTGQMLFHHLICPILSIISFIIFEGDRRLNKKKTIYIAMIPTLVYGFVLILLNILRIVDGPYPFLQVYNQTWYMSLVWIIVIFCANYIFARIILLQNQIHAPRIKKK